jgi:hypothetical protein
MASETVKESTVIITPPGLCSPKFLLFIRQFGCGFLPGQAGLTTPTGIQGRGSPVNQFESGASAGIQKAGGFND